MAAEYQEPDRAVVDYQAFRLDEDIIDPTTKRPLHIRGPRPDHLEKGCYFVCLGAAQTFGRFCERPFPSLLSEHLDMPVLNISHGGAGASFFCNRNERLLSHLNAARFVVIQVMSGRSESSSYFESDGVGFYRRRNDGRTLGCDQAFAELLSTESKENVLRVVEETRDSWITSYARLAAGIRVPTVLFWFAKRPPHYPQSLRRVDTLFGDFPQLVNERMVGAVRGHCSHYVECVTRRGLPHILKDRFTGKRATVTDAWTSKPWTENWYYPSPEMHEDAARALAPVCRSLVRSEHASLQRFAS